MDALGLIIAVVITAESVTDTATGVRLLDRVVERTPTATRAWVDTGSKDDLADHGVITGVDIGIVRRSDSGPGFAPVRERWLVAQVNGAFSRTTGSCAMAKLTAELAGVEDEPADLDTTTRRCSASPPNNSPHRHRRSPATPTSRSLPSFATPPARYERNTSAGPWMPRAHGPPLKHYRLTTDQWYLS